MSFLHRILIIFLMNGALVTQAAAGPIYKIYEKDGSIRFTNKEPPAGVRAQVFTAHHGSFAYYKAGGFRRIFGGGKLSRKYWDVIERAARHYSLERNLVQAVIHAESCFDPYAISSKGARGLMQIMPDTARMLGIKNIAAVEENIFGGTRYLAFLLRKYQGNLRFALAAYNAGEGAVEKFNGVPPYRETVDYVDQVLRLRKRYETFANG